MSGTYDPRITAYFGDAVLQAGFMPLPHLFLRHYRSLGLSQVQAMFVLQLMEIAWDLGDPPNSVSKIAMRMGLSQRSVRACSKEVHDLALIEIYDQWDDAGAQVENAYDLGPLFRRLAALIPAQVPSGQQRLRRQRDHSPVGTPAARAPGVEAENTSSKAFEQVDSRHSLQPVRQEASLALPVQKSTLPPMKNPASPPLHEVSWDPRHDPSVPPGTNDQVPNESTIIGPLQKSSELIEENKKQPKKPLRKQQEHHGGGVQPQMPNTMFEQSGFSLRTKVTISAADVLCSRTILDRAGLHTMVAEHAAPTLTPAECWSLVCYARGASLGAAWIATQVYDWTQRQPQPSQLNRRYDEVGRLLAMVPMEQCYLLLDITDRYCPDAREQWESTISELRADLSPIDAAALEQALNAVWLVMAEQRHGLAPRTTVDSPTTPSTPPQSAYAEEWSTVLGILQNNISYSDWRSWIAPLELLEIEQDTAIIGAPNVFVRNEVSTTYMSSIVNALCKTFGRELQVEVVIGTMVLG